MPRCRRTDSMRTWVTGMVGWALTVGACGPLKDRGSAREQAGSPRQSPARQPTLLEKHREDGYADLQARSRLSAVSRGMDVWTRTVVELRGGPGQSCTGVYLGDGRVLTAAHCVSEDGSCGSISGSFVTAQGMALPLQTCRRALAARPRFGERDVALLFFDAAPLMGVAIAYHLEPYTPRPGEPIFTLGFGYGALNKGTGCAVMGRSEDGLGIRHSCSTVQGMSGSPLFLAQGTTAFPTVIGVVSGARGAFNEAY